MPQSTGFIVKFQLHFGGDIHDVSVSASDGIEPTVADLMNLLERNFRVPRALQSILYCGQELQSRPNERLSRFGIRSGVPIRLVGRMVPPNKVNQINVQYGDSLPQQTYYTQPLNTIPTYENTTQNLPYYGEQIKYIYHTSVGTQYDPPPLGSADQNQSAPVSNQG